MTDEPVGQVAQTEPGLTFCYRHPKVETGLRCNRCGKPICPKCAVQTHVGYRCPDCVKQQQSVYYNSKSYDYVIAAAISLPLAALAGAFLSALGFLVIFIGPAVGAAIAEIVRRAVGRRRGRYLALTVGGCTLLGGLAAAMIWPLIMVFFFLTQADPQAIQATGSMMDVLFAMFGGGSCLWSIAYLVLSVGTAYGRLK